MIFHAEKTEEKFTCPKLMDHVKTMRNGRYTIEIKQYRKSRSMKMNRLYWLFLNQISVETGNDADTMHGYFKIKFLPPRIEKIKGKGGKEYEVELPPTTTTLSTSEIYEYMDKISALVDLPIPNPEEQYE